MTYNVKGKLGHVSWPVAGHDKSTRQCRLYTNKKRGLKGKFHHGGVGAFSGG